MVYPKFCIYLVIVGWQLIEKLFNPVFLSRTVNVRDLLLWQAGKIQLDLTRRNAEFRPRDTQAPSTSSVLWLLFYLRSHLRKKKRSRYIRL